MKALPITTAFEKLKEKKAAYKRAFANLAYKRPEELVDFLAAEKIAFDVHGTHSRITMRDIMEMNNLYAHSYYAESAHVEIIRLLKTEQGPEWVKYAGTIIGNYESAEIIRDVINANAGNEARPWDLFKTHPYTSNFIYENFIHDQRAHIALAFNDDTEKEINGFYVQLIAALDKLLTNDKFECLIYTNNDQKQVTYTVFHPDRPTKEGHEIAIKCEEGCELLSVPRSEPVIRGGQSILGRVTMRALTQDECGEAREILGMVTKSA